MSSMNPRKASFLVVLLCSFLVAPDLVRATPLLSLDGEWPTFGFTSDQTRNKLKGSAVLPDVPSQIWSETLPAERFGGYSGDQAIGPDGTIYAPFYGRGWNTGGVQAITSDGRLKWYFKSSEVGFQAPLVVERNQDGETMVLFGNGRSLVAIYDTEDCRCCVERKPDSAQNEFDYCDFQCEADASLCETNPDLYEWRHRFYDAGAGPRCGSDDWTSECGAWHVANEDIDPPVTAPENLPVASAAPLLSQDGGTVYHLVSDPNYVAAVDVATGSLKWSLSEDGWVGAECPDAEPGGPGFYEDHLLGTPVLLSDGSFVFGTSGSCLVRVVDHGTYGQAEGVYRYTANSPVSGMAVEHGAGGNDSIFVATHARTPFNEGFIYKTDRDGLIAGSAPDWVYYASRAVTQQPGLDRGGVWRAPALAEVSGTKYLYAAVIDLPNDNPDRGWVVRIPAEAGPGSYQVVGGQYQYQNDVVAELKLGDTWYPGRQCTIDGAGKVYVHGGKNEPTAGKVLRLNPDLSGLTSLLDVPRSGPSELVLGDDYLVAVAGGAWFPKSLGNPQDWLDRFEPVVYKLGVPAGGPPDEISLSVSRADYVDTSFPTVVATATVLDDASQPWTGDVEFTAFNPGGYDYPASVLAVSQVSSLGQGQYSVEVACSVSGEIKIVATASDGHVSVEADETVLFLPYVAAEWEIPRPLTEVNTSGQEDSVSISPDGKTLFFSYTPLSCCVPPFEDPLSPRCSQAHGPYGPPERPGFLGGNLEGVNPDGSVTLGLYGNTDPEVGWASTLSKPVQTGYTAYRQADGTFGTLTPIGFEDDGIITEASLVSGPVSPVPGQPFDLFFAYEDWLDFNGDQVYDAVFAVATVTEGVATSLGRADPGSGWTRGTPPAGMIAQSLTGPIQTYLASHHFGEYQVYQDPGDDSYALYFEAADKEMPQQNCLFDGQCGAGHHCVALQCTDDFDLVASDLTGTYPTGDWTAGSPLPSTLNTEDYHEKFPWTVHVLLDGGSREEIYFTRQRLKPTVQASFNDRILMSHEHGGAWVTPVEVIRADDDSPRVEGRITRLALPAVADSAMGTEMFFVYGVETEVGGDDRFDLQIGVLRRAE